MSSGKVKSRQRGSRLRSEQAAATRARIVDAAGAVFSSRGYEAARIEDIAAEAGIAVPTVYKAFLNKRNLLKAAVDVAVSGDVGGRPERQAWFREQLEEPDAERQLRLVARNARQMYDRAGRLLDAVRAAALGDGEIQALWHGLHDDRLARSRATARSLARKARLRGSVAETAKTLWTLSVPELYVLQVHGADLSPDDYERWLGDLLVATLLETGSS